MAPLIQQLAKDILLSAPQGISKVKFAKTIYFVYKHLVLGGAYRARDLSFIRMPLGPVPVGFKSLATDPDIKVISQNASYLTYNQETYRLDENFIQSHQVNDMVDDVVTKLLAFTTSQLVEESHKEPSWLGRHNGDEYTITQADLSLSLPAKPALLNENTEDQHIQAQLIVGMLDDIVDESTALEYPVSRQP